MTSPLNNVTAYITHGVDPFTDAELGVMLDELRTHLEIAENDRLRAAQDGARPDAMLRVMQQKLRINSAITEILAHLNRDA